MILEVATKEDESDPAMALAAFEAAKSPQRFQLGAVIKKGKRIISSGYNQYKTHPKFGFGRWGYLHAESHAISRALSLGREDDLKGATLYVYRRGCLPSKPCKQCEQVIRQYGIKRVIYTYRIQNDKEGTDRKAQRYEDIG